MENNTNTKITTPQAIIVAGVLIMVGMLLSRTNNIPKPAEPKTLSEQVGVSKDALTACIQKTDIDTLSKNIKDSVDKATKGLADNQRGTPYSVIIGKNGNKVDIHGADSYDNVMKAIASVRSGNIETKYMGEVPMPNANDHIIGNLNADIVIVEYSDFECPYCKAFNPTMKKIVSESNGNIAWIYRHWPIHQHSLEKLVAAECVAQIKGNDAFWKYSDLLLKTAETPVEEQL
jgi:protein-disulfide isomerase